MCARARVRVFLESSLSRHFSLHLATLGIFVDTPRLTDPRWATFAIFSYQHRAEFARRDGAAWIIYSHRLIPAEAMTIIAHDSKARWDWKLVPFTALLARERGLWEFERSDRARTGVSFRDISGEICNEFLLGKSLYRNFIRLGMNFWIKKFGERFWNFF